MPITTLTARARALRRAARVGAQTVFPKGPDSPDNDDIEGLREQYKRANKLEYLWDEPGGSRPRSPQASIRAQAAHSFAASLSEAITQKLGRRSRAEWEANRDARQERFENKAARGFTEGGYVRRGTKYLAP